MPRIDAVLTRAAEKAPSHDAVWEWSTGRRVTYAELDAHVTSLAVWLGAHGTRPGDAVGIHLPNSAAFLTAQFGSLRAQALATYVNYRLSAEEARRQLAMVGARVIVTTLDRARALRDFAGFEHAHFIVTDDDPPFGTSLSSILARRVETGPPFQSGEDADAIARFTSGSTGAPKGIIVSHRAWLIRAVSILAEEVQVDHGAVTLLLSPLSHYAGLFVLPTFMRTGTLLLFDRFDLDEVSRALETRTVACAQMVPTMIGMFAEAPRARVALLASGVKRIIYAGSPIQPQLLGSMLDMLPSTEFIQGYGSHEAGSISVLHDAAHRDPVLRLSAGRPYLAAHVRISNGPGEEVGEIEVNAPWTPRVRITERGRERVTEDWIPTGDIGELRDGFLFLKDRAGDVIISGGFNVYPREVEAVIDAHPAVRASAVVSSPDPKWGERVVAFVVPREAIPFDSQSLRDHCRAHLATYKVPKEFHVIESIPLNPNGKPDRRHLSGPLWQGRARRIN